MRVLITGGAGFIGSHVADKLLSKGHDVWVFDNLDPQVHKTNEWPDYLNPNVTKILGDCFLNYDLLKDTIVDNDIEAIYHFASKVGVGQSMFEIKKYTDSSVGGTANLLQILTEYPIKKLIIASSMSCYGEGLYQASDALIEKGLYRTDDQLKNRQWEYDGLTPLPTPESKPFESNSIYALNKNMQEAMCMSFGKAYDIPVVALRFWNAYGSRQSLSNAYTGVAAIFCGCFLSDKKPLIFEDGNQKRDFIHIDDLVQACYLALIDDKANFESYNVGSGHPLSVLDLVNTIGQELKPDGYEYEVTGNYRVGDVRHCYPDISKIKRELGYEPKYAFRDGVKDLISWVKEQKSTIAIDEMKDELGKRNLIK